MKMDRSLLMRMQQSLLVRDDALDAVKVFAAQDTCEDPQVFDFRNESRRPALGVFHNAFPNLVMR